MNYRAEAITQEDLDSLVRQLAHERCEVIAWRRSADSRDEMCEKAKARARSAETWIAGLVLIVVGLFLTFGVLFLNNADDCAAAKNRAREEADDRVWEAEMMLRVAAERMEAAEDRELESLRDCMRLEP